MPFISLALHKLPPLYPILSLLPNSSFLSEDAACSLRYPQIQRDNPCLTSMCPTELFLPVICPASFLPRLRCGLRLQNYVELCPGRPKANWKGGANIPSPDAYRSYSQPVSVIGAPPKGISGKSYIWLNYFHNSKFHNSK